MGLGLGGVKAVFLCVPWPSSARPAMYSARASALLFPPIAVAEAGEDIGEDTGEDTGEEMGACLTPSGSRGRTRPEARPELAIWSKRSNSLLATVE